jgi:ABC-type phosphate transport system substrate-binding protein
MAITMQAALPCRPALPSKTVKQPIPTRRLIPALLACFWLAAGVAYARDKSDDLAIVVNKSSVLENVSSSELAKIFKAERRKSSDGTKFSIVMREKDSDERHAALKSIYEMDDSEYEKYFLQATFAGTVQSAPRVLSSSAVVLQFVSSNPGAIGYMRASAADGSVKVLKVDGKAPGDADYPIKIKN